MSEENNENLKIKLEEIIRGTRERNKTLEKILKELEEKRKAGKQ
jgi:hypothetical protein